MGYAINEPGNGTLKIGSVSVPDWPSHK